jgi:hypothetical protein
MILIQAHLTLDLVKELVAVAKQWVVRLLIALEERPKEPLEMTLTPAINSN